MGRLSLPARPRRKHGDDALQIRAGPRPLFPRVSQGRNESSGNRYILDGELAVPSEDGLSFDQLLQRIHPAESRIKRLSAETPAIFVAFDLLERNTLDLARSPLAKRRTALEARNVVLERRCFSDSRRRARRLPMRSVG